ncbi:hypothetical protein [Actinomadura viridis]|uniref:Uncharacterized protein n=1 Tax=Actinomadura viridis TaxID=58110 RepID=A0A931DGW4_9ACTN|nr:hypothetical protein [Actinomadura viridis]MBG6090914.1 hypothetical protein [Actinomadura viridis]
MNKKYVKLAAGAFVLWYIITRPDAAAHVVNSALSGLGGAAESMSQFVSALA